MGFFSNLLGTNQKYSTKALAGQYNAAYKPAMDAAEQVGGLGQDMLDRDSAFNLDAKNRMMTQGQDAVAEGNRRAERLMAMGGGGNSAALAAQTAGNVNKALDSSNQSFNQYLAGNFDKGVGMITSSANNMTAMKENKMNAINQQRQRNAQIDSQAAGAMANFGGQLLEQAVPGLGFFMQQGGMLEEDKEYMAYGGKVQYQKGGDVFKPHTMYKGGKEVMVNSLQEHLRLKKAGYIPKKEMAEGGFLSRLMGKEQGNLMPTQEELDKMKPYDAFDDYHYRDERSDSMPQEFRELPEAQEDAEGEGMTQFDENDAMFKRMNKEKAGYKQGGMISNIMGPKGPMTIPTRLGGYSFGK